MTRQAHIFFQDQFAGTLSETPEGYSFVYDPTFLSSPNAHGISLTMPLRPEPYLSPTMFAFFDGLIPEGWLLDIASEGWKIDPRDRMGLLLLACHNTIGAVSVRLLEGEPND